MSTKVVELQSKYAEYAISLIAQGIMDDQFNCIQNMQDNSNPKFLSEILRCYLGDMPKLIHSLALDLQQQHVDFVKLDKTLHNIKGSSSSIGAICVLNACNAFVACCKEQDVEGCFNCWEQTSNAFALVKLKLEALLILEQQIRAAGGIVPKPAGY
ncbi:histidine-containing phosphotransfer protein 1-like [Chenopodium quinoa]|uniref:histidine-containing phosphotransfer protein 1-like n=1 Tax=Chenopodium quinoa TaxID=63459 RepID=UPI000B77FC44|nr:histidine-containing phosphotransfer protein 1-like [Chenopodium quinoa]